MIDYTLWEAIRVILAFAAYVMLPGYLVLRLVDRRRALARLESLSLSFCLGAAVNVAVGYSVHWVSGSLTAFAYVMLSVTLLVATANGLCLVRSDRKLSGLQVKAPHWETGALLLLSAIVFSLNLRNGVRVIYVSDTWFHIAHIREIVDSGCIVPQNPFWPAAPLSETAAIWHSILALVSHSSGVDVVRMWPMLNAIMCLITLASIYVFAATSLHDKRIAVFAAVLFVLLGRGVRGTAVWPSGASYVLIWMAFSYFLRYLRDGGRRALLLGLLAAVMPVFWHPQETVLVCASIACFMVVRTLASVSRKTSLRRACIFLLAVVLVALPLLMLHYPQNVSEVVSRGGHRDGPDRVPEAPLLLDVLESVYPQRHAKTRSFFREFLPLGLISLLFSWRLLGRFGDDWAELLLALTWAPVVLFFVPGLSHATIGALTKTYAWHVTVLIPAAFVLAFVVGSGCRDLWRLLKGPVETSGGSSSVMSAAVLSVLLSLLAVQQVPSLVQKPNDPAPSPLDTPEVFQALNGLPSSSVILSDPLTSYVIPGLTPQIVVLNEATHGGLPDLRERLAAARELLSSPYQSHTEALHTLASYRVDYVLVNLAWMDDPFGLAVPFYSEYTLDFLDRNRLCFTVVYDDTAFRLYRYNRGRCGVDQLSGKGETREVPLQREDLDHIVDTTLVQGLHLAGFSSPQDLRTVPGAQLELRLLWEALEPVEHPCAISMEILCDYPQADEPYGKILRKVYERRTGQALKANEFHWLPLPAGNLDSGETLSDKAKVQIPINMPTGQCDLVLYVLGNEKQFSNRPLLPGLLLENHYLYPGVRLGEVTIETSADWDDGRSCRSVTCVEPLWKSPNNLSILSGAELGDLVDRPCCRPAAPSKAHCPRPSQLARLALWWPRASNGRPIHE